MWRMQMCHQSDPFWDVPRTAGPQTHWDMVMENRTPLGFSITRSMSRQRRRFVHLEVYPSEHRDTWSFTEHAQALLAPLRARIQPGEEKRVCSHAPDHRSPGG